MFLIGGCNFEERTISNQTLEVNKTTGFVTNRKKMPRAKFAHAACLVRDEIVVTSGISDLMLNMGLRTVPIGDRDCFSYNIREARWWRLPDVPIGKLHPTLI